MASSQPLLLSGVAGPAGATQLLMSIIDLKAFCLALKSKYYFHQQIPQANQRRNVIPNKLIVICLIPNYAFKKKSDNKKN